MSFQSIHRRISKYGKPFNAGGGIRIVIGGDPHSGKSSFMRMLELDLKEKNINVKLFELDVGSGDVKRFTVGTRIKKIPWTDEIAHKANINYIRASEKYDVTLGDTPGKITQHTSIVTNNANAAIILAKDEDAKRRWINFFNKRGITILTIINSKMFSGETTFNPRYSTGNIIGISREKVMKLKKSENIVVESVSYEIAKRFGLTFRSYKQSGTEIGDRI